MLTEQLDAFVRFLADRRRARQARARRRKASPAVGRVTEPGRLLTSAPRPEQSGPFSRVEPAAS